MSDYAVRSFGPLHHRFWNTQPTQRDGMIEETWRLGPFELTREYVNGDKRYGSWNLGVLIAWRGWRGPWLHINCGSGAQNWDADEKWWQAADQREGQR